MPLQKSARDPNERFDGDYQRKVGEFVAREVIYYVSYLVSEIAGKEPNCQIFSVFDPDRAREMIGDEIAGDPDLAADIEDFDLDNLEDVKAAFAQLDLDYSEAESEVFEHWIVSSWLADKLEAKGEMVERDFYGLTIWGRSTTGQAIAIDDVICTIYDETRAID